MRRLAILWFLAACTGRGQSPDPDLSNPDDPPAVCGCISDPALPTDDFCCDSHTCFFDDETQQWQIVICDPPPDPCLFCAADEICVQAFDGTCASITTCVARTVECPNHACTPDCELAYCGDSVAQCENRTPCGTESPLAFTCYGP